jgi:hypothetical protein
MHASVREAAESVLGRHHKAFLSMFKQMMVGVFGPGMEQIFSRVSPSGALYRDWGVQLRSASRNPTTIAGTANPASSTKHWGQPIQPPPHSAGSQPVQPPLRVAGGQPVQPPLQGSTGQPVQKPNPYQPTYWEMVFAQLECRPIPPTR